MIYAFDRHRNVRYEACPGEPLEQIRDLVRRVGNHGGQVDFHCSRGFLSGIDPELLGKDSADHPTFEGIPIIEEGM